VCNLYSINTNQAAIISLFRSYQRSCMVPRTWFQKTRQSFLFEKGCDKVVIRSGQMGNVHLSPEAEAYFERKGCEVVLKPTPEAIRMFNRSRIKRIGLFHVTC
jgi:hypothetical protein